MSNPSSSPRLTQLAAALAWVWLATPAGAAIVTLGDVNPNPASGTVVGPLNVGPTNPGQLSVTAGSILTTDTLWVANTRVPRGGNGQVNVTGAGSLINVTWSDRGNFDLGGSGTGTMLLSDGGRVQYGPGNADCQLNCRMFVGNAAGSTGSLTITGTGSRLDTVGRITVGQASLFREAAGDTLNYGELGGHGSGRAEVTAGGQVQSGLLLIGNPGGSVAARSGQETAAGTVIVDGIGSVWSVVRTAAEAGGRALLSMALGPNTSGSLDIRNGGRMTLDGSSAPLELSGINTGSTPGGAAQSSSASLRVDGPGSRLELGGGVGFINLGRGVGQTAQLQVSNGGVVTGTTANGLGFMSVGRGGATGTVDITGTGSLLRLSGIDAVGSGAFLHVGRFEGGAAGQGTFNIGNGGRLEIDNSGQVLTSNNQTGMHIGIGAGADGSMTVTGAGSVLSITGSTGKTPYVGVGRDGATGQFTVSAGGLVEVSSQHVSLPSATGYATGEAVFFDVGARHLGSDGLASSGSLTVTGTGSELRLSGSADRLLRIGVNEGSTGSLNINNGGKVTSTGLLVGTRPSASGSFSMNGGLLVLEGDRLGGPAAPGGAGLSLGRGGGSAVATIGNGSRITINTTAPEGGLSVGGSNIEPGGTATMQVSGGSTIQINGPRAAATVGSGGLPGNAAVGTLTLSGAGTGLSVSGTGARVLVGNSPFSVGTLVVGAGATLSSSDVIGVTHNGTGSTGGSGTLVVNGTANASRLMVGRGGLLGGSGVINANVTNRGQVAPGNSPGRLTINGAFDSMDGQIVLEVQALGNGLFDIDEIVFGNPDQVDIGNAEIEFRFLGDTDPLAFLDSGDFNLASFFKQGDGAAGVTDLDDSRLGLFAGALFSATAERYTITRFSFDPLRGADLAATAIPLAPTWALILLALPALGLKRRRALA